MAINAALAKKIADAKPSGGGGIRLKDGEFVLMIKQIICEAKHKGVMYIPEFEVVASEATRDDVVPNKPGTDASCAWAMDGTGNAGTAAKGNIKQFFCALFGLADDDETFNAELGKYAGEKGDADALRARGMLVACRTYRKTIQTGNNAGKEGCFPEFTRVSEADGNSADEIAARRKDLDSRKR